MLEGPIWVTVSVVVRCVCLVEVCLTSADRRDDMVKTTRGRTQRTLFFFGNRFTGPLLFLVPGASRLELMNAKLFLLRKRWDGMSSHNWLHFTGVPVCVCVCVCACVCVCVCVCVRVDKPVSLMTVLTG